MLIDARHGAVPHNKTGRMMGSLKTSSSYLNGVITVVLESDQIQTITTNFGAQGHMIFPRDRKRGVLHWRTGGQDYYSRGHWHPGNRAFGWLTRVLRTWPTMVRDEFRRLR